MHETDTTEYAYAKINLFLHVTGQRGDGYHLLDSLAVFAEVADVLTVTTDTELRLSLRGHFAPVLLGEGGDNLVLRAARSLGPGHVPQGAHLTLDKQLPVASGIGGGSADAAASLRLLRRFWARETLDADALHALAASLGADVPVCLRSRPARMQGVGERLTAAPALPSSLGMALINCGEQVSTQAVFRMRAELAGASYSAPACLPGGWHDASSMAETLSRVSNDLEPAACRLCPTIDRVLASLRALPGCRLARMSGSGATCFGLFDNPHAARTALAARVWPDGWWCWAGGLHCPQDGSRTGLLPYGRQVEQRGRRSN